MMALLIIFSVLFAVTHIVPCHGSIREGLVEKLGEMGYKGAYSIVSFITIGPMIYIYFFTDTSMGTRLWAESYWLLPVVYLLMLMGLLLFTLMLGNPSPAGMMPAAMEPRGVLRITRHPMNMGFSCIALAHIIANATLGDAFFWGSIFVVGFIGAYHQDFRKAREKGKEFEAFQLQTSVLPFAAIVRGRTKLVLSELSIPLVIIAVVAFVGLIFFHNKLFGASPF